MSNLPNITRHKRLIDLVFFLMLIAVDANAFEDIQNRSFFISVNFGSNLDLQTTARSPRDANGDHPESYGLVGFLIGMNAGYRFSEWVGLEAGFHEAQHRADKTWGQYTRYTLAHLGVRAALPLETRQTPVLMLGAAIGRFAFGTASFGQPEDNATLTVGPTVGITLEHELTLGLVAIVNISYAPLFRKGMDGILKLEEVKYDSEGNPEIHTIDTKDFTKSTFVHLLWLKIGFQFEWTI